MIGKAICLLVVLVIASQASEITTEQEVSSHLDSDVGPGTVLAEVSASTTRGDGLRDLTFAVDDMEEDVDGSRIDDYEEERREEKRRRRAAARRRAEKRRKERRERRRAAKAERARKRKARKAARKLARAMRKNMKIGTMAKQGMKSDPQATAAALTRALFPATNGSNATNATNSTTANYTIDPKIIERHLRQAELTKADLRLYKKAKADEKRAAHYRSKDRYYKTRAAQYEQWKQQRKLAEKRKFNSARTSWAVRQGMASIKSLQGEMESEDVRKDKLFWDQYYGRKRVEGKGDKQAKKDDSKTVATLAHDDKHVDLALPLYKASHIASYLQASGRSKKIVKLDNNLKEDGDKYIEYSLSMA